MSERDPSAPDVKIYEVGPRDGLQNEAEFVPTDSKLELIALLAASGLRRIEVASFVSPSWIPQLADGDELVIDAIVPPETLRDEIAARLATAEGRRDVPPAKWRSVTPV